MVRYFEFIQLSTLIEYSPGNEKEVGRAIRDSGVPRNDIYLTTKLP